MEEDLENLAATRKLALSYGEAVTRRRKRKEKSTIILVAIVMVFILCHMYRLFVEVYRLMYPSNILKETYIFCDKKGKLTMPVLLYIFHNLHFLIQVCKHFHGLTLSTFLDLALLLFSVSYWLVRHFT